LSCIVLCLGYLRIDYERITKIRYNIIDDGDENLPSSAPSRKSEKTNNTSIGHLDSSSHDFISEQLLNNKSVTVNFHFSVADRNETSEDTLTGLHVVTLLLLASERHASIDLCEDYSFAVETLTIVSDRDKTRQEFCDDPDVLYIAKNGVIRRRITSSGDIDYVVDVPELETTYEGGDFTYVFMVSTLTPQNQTVIFSL
jgi:hypothetical protein